MFGSLPPVSRDPGRPADQDDLVDVVRPDLGVRHGLTDRPHRPFHEIRREVLELRAHQRHREVLRPVRVRGDEGQVDLGLRDRAQLDLCLLGRLVEPLQRLRVLPQVDAVLLLELLGQVVDDPPVEVVAAEVGVTGGGTHLHDTVADVEDADVERPAAEVEHQHRLVLALVHPVGQRRGGRLVDDPQDLEAGDPPRVAGGCSLRVVEVGRDGDHRLGDPLAEVPSGVVGELAEDQRGDLLRRIHLVPHLDPGEPVRIGDHVIGDLTGLLLDLVESAADEPLDRVDRALGVEDRLPAGQLADETLPVLRERHHRRRRAGALRVGYDRGLAPFPGGDDRVRRPEVDTHRARHLRSSLRSAGRPDRPPRRRRPARSAAGA
jgi:hypothetical protein